MQADRKVSEAFHEVYENVPKSVKKTGKKGKAKRAMMTAIALSKARASGAKIPKGGITQLHKGDLKASFEKDRADNLSAKNEFRKRQTGAKIRF